MVLGGNKRRKVVLTAKILKELLRPKEKENNTMLSMANCGLSSILWDISDLSLNYSNHKIKNKKTRGIFI